jgi:hypothetical protein
MALTMVSLTNTINNIAERDQYLERDIVFTVDEAHIRPAANGGAKPKQVCRPASLTRLIRDYGPVFLQQCP